MPKKLLWPELLFSYFPVDKKVFWQQMLARICFIFAVWLIGLLAYTLDGQAIRYLTNFGFHIPLFGVGFIVLFASYMIQGDLGDRIQNFRPMLKLDDSQFQKLSERIERYSYSFLPCLFIALVGVSINLFLSLPSATSEFQQVLGGGLHLVAAWFFFINFFYWLLTATGLWMFVSIWIAILLISRQPLNVKLSPETIEKFRGLSMLALWFALFYFVGVSIGNISFLASAPILSILEIIVSPYLFFTAIGIIGVLLPFYNIHNALLKLKKRELSKISDESGQLMRQLDEVLAKTPASQITEQGKTKVAQTTAITARLLVLQVKEKRVKAAPEWPIDVGFVSKLMGLGLIPILGRIVAEIFTRYF